MARVSCRAFDRSRMFHGRARGRVIRDLATIRVEGDVHLVYGSFYVLREDEISFRPKVETDLPPPDWEAVRLASLRWETLSGVS